MSTTKLYASDNLDIPRLMQLQEGKVNKVDCVKALQSIETGSVQCVFADPPFNLGKK